MQMVVEEDLGFTPVHIFTATIESQSLVRGEGLEKQRLNSINTWHLRLRNKIYENK